MGLLLEIHSPILIPMKLDFEYRTYVHLNKSVWRKYCYQIPVWYASIYSNTYMLPQIVWINWLGDVFGKISISRVNYIVWTITYTLKTLEVHYVFGFGIGGNKVIKSIELKINPHGIIFYTWIDGWRGAWFRWRCWIDLGRRWNRSKVGVLTGGQFILPCVPFTLITMLPK
jgi:hypothetical protein